VLYVHPNMPPFSKSGIQTAEVDYFRVRQFVCQSMTEHFLRWGMRALSAMFDTHTSVLLYYPGKNFDLEEVKYFH